jgi:hypothetical protein
VVTDISACGQHACLSSWETRIQSLVGPPETQGLKITEEKVLYLYIDINKWLDFRVFSDKDVKSSVPRIPYQLGKSLLAGNPLSSGSEWETQYKGLIPRALFLGEMRIISPVSFELRLLE